LAGTRGAGLGSYGRTNCFSEGRKERDLLPFDGVARHLHPTEGSDGGEKMPLCTGKAMSREAKQQDAQSRRLCRKETKVPLNSEGENQPLRRGRSEQGASCLGKGENYLPSSMFKKIELFQGTEKKDRTRRKERTQHFSFCKARPGPGTSSGTGEVGGSSPRIAQRRRSRRTCPSGVQQF